MQKEATEMFFYILYVT